MAMSRGVVPTVATILVGVWGHSAYVPAQVLTAAGLTGQATPPRRPKSFGTASQSILTFGAWNLVPNVPSATWHIVPSSILRYFDFPGAELEGGIQLPSGVLIEKIELEACDNSADGEVIGGLASWAVPGGSGALLGVIETGDAATPGCAVFPLTLANPVTVENQNFQYQVAASSNTFDGTTSIAAVRVYYRRQVSPSPIIPSFSDVPTDDFGFQYIEALVSSGITGGCSGGNFCPDAAVTRRQMAIFLAKALGLHWPD
jgi:S-layer homology domain